MTKFLIVKYFHRYKSHPQQMNHQLNGTLRFMLQSHYKKRHIIKIRAIDLFQMMKKSPFIIKKLKINLKTEITFVMMLTRKSLATQIHLNTVHLEKVIF
jgi:hypothetical protein